MYLGKFQQSTIFSTIEIATFRCLLIHYFFKEVCVYGHKMYHCMLWLYAGYFFFLYKKWKFYVCLIKRNKISKSMQNLSSFFDITKFQNLLVVLSVKISVVHGVMLIFARPKKTHKPKTGCKWNINIYGHIFYLINYCVVLSITKSYPPKRGKCSSN